MFQIATLVAALTHTAFASGRRIRAVQARWRGGKPAIEAPNVGMIVRISGWCVLTMRFGTFGTAVLAPSDDPRRKTFVNSPDLPKAVKRSNQPINPQKDDANKAYESEERDKSPENVLNEKRPRRQN